MGDNVILNFYSVWIKSCLEMGRIYCNTKICFMKHAQRGNLQYVLFLLNLKLWLVDLLFNLGQIQIFVDLDLKNFKLIKIVLLQFFILLMIKFILAKIRVISILWSQILDILLVLVLEFMFKMIADKKMKLIVWVNNIYILSIMEEYSITTIESICLLQGDRKSFLRRNILNFMVSNDLKSFNVYFWFQNWQ